MLAELRELWRFRELLFSLVERELRIRYKNSFFGFLWSLLNPLITVVVITLVFKNFLRNDTPNLSAYILAAYLAIALEVEVEPETGRVRVVRAVSAIDSGEIVNPDGIRNQTEGGILQSISWTLYEQVTFDRTRITSADWSSYPILRFASVPDSVEVHIVERPGEPFLGTGEAAQGPAAAAVGNAIRNATGRRLYDLPLTRERVRGLRV